MSVNQELLAEVVETICQQGCKVVLRVISEMDAGRPVAALEGLCDDGKSLVLEELQSIMSVYDNVCRL